jgi:hypothetical protein
MKANLRNLDISTLGPVLGLIAAPGFALQFPDEGRPSRHHPVRVPCAKAHDSTERMKNHQDKLVAVAVRPDGNSEDKIVSQRGVI